MPLSSNCPFCAPDPERVLLDEPLIIGLWDKFPVSEGHALLAPKRHVSGWLNASPEERRALTDAVAKVVEITRERHGPFDGFNIGVNSGEAAGQTVPHLHVHVIPRRKGDVANPRGGVRAVVPEKADYLAHAATPTTGIVADSAIASAHLTAVPRELAAAEQVHFLSKVQSLLDGGLFSATYKYALLLALADIAIERDEDACDELGQLIIPTDLLAEKFIEYYWNHCRPFVASGGTIQGRLLQNTGTQAKVLSVLAELHEKHAGRLSAIARDRPSWERLVREVGAVVRQMPLWKLQTIGRETVDFLYPNVEHGSSITLRPGIAFCLRRFHGLVGNLVRGAWVDWVRRQNRELVGDSADLAEFLFGAERQRLRAIAPILHELQSGRCIYSGERLARPEDCDVDHFIPFAKYPHDYGHNLVLATKSANAAKADFIASEAHLERWLERHRTHGAMLVAECDRIGLPVDLGRTLAVARWAYEQADHAGTPVWTKGRDTGDRLSGEWRRLLRNVSFVIGTPISGA